MDVNSLPKTRAEAKKLNSQYYYTGKPCKYGHVAARKTKGSCVVCLVIEWEKSYEKRQEYFNKYNKSESGQKAKREYYERNRDAVIARAQSRPDEAKRAYRRTHKINNPDMYRELVSLRRRRFRNATPKWLSAIDKIEIRLKYRLAIEMSRATGVRHAVDHIIPLYGDTVCGLHVPWNLRVITQAENLKKYNKLEP